MNKVHKLHAAMDDCGEWAADRADLRTQTAERGHALGYCASTCEWGCVQGHRRCKPMPAEACSEIGAEPATGHPRPFGPVAQFLARNSKPLGLAVAFLIVMAILLAATK